MHWITKYIGRLSHALFLRPFQDFVDGKIKFESQLSDLEAAMKNVASASDVTIAEGTGHCAVGSIVGLNNAKVASLLGADMVSQL